MRRFCGLVLGLLVWGSASALGGAPAGNRARAEIHDTPRAYLRGCISNAARRMEGKYTGDAWTWHARHPMDGFIDAYLATRDTEWLDAAVEYFDWCIAQLLTGPDGRLGWLGPAYRMEDRLGEYPVGDALMMGPMVRLAELVLKDEPALAEAYGPAARRYVDLAIRLVFEKWWSRGIWREDGDYGAFTNWPWTYTEETADRWQEPPAGRGGFTLPINMQVYWGVIAARLHRITGEERWQTTALKIFNFAKSRLTLYDGHYSWNYWEPFGPWDVRANNPQDFRSWINTHPYRNYQAGEVAAFVEAYNRGITFDAEDMKRLVRTNLAVMWNGDLEAPQWHNSNAGVRKAAVGEIRLEPPQGDGTYAGTLWTALTQFDAMARDIRRRQLTVGDYQHAYHHNVVESRPATLARRYEDVEPVVLDFPFSPCSTLTMVAVIPSRITAGESALVACQGRAPGELTVELRSGDGARRLAVLKQASLQRAPHILNLPLDTEGIAPGQYRVRWTLSDAYREFPIEIRGSSRPTSESDR